MKRKLKARNTKRMNWIFSKADVCFPQYSGQRRYLGKVGKTLMFSAPSKLPSLHSFIVDSEAIWSEDD